MENKAYYVELSRVLKKHYIESGPMENGRLVILLDGQSVGRIEKGAIRCIAPGDLQTVEASKAFQLALLNKIWNYWSFNSYNNVL